MGSGLFPELDAVAARKRQSWLGGSLIMPADRVKPEGSADTRSRILDATEQIMLDEGYAGVSSRKVAARAGLKSNLMHYHFATMDDLFVAAFQRRERQHMACLADAAASDEPLRDLWNLAVDAASSRLYLEFNALACHRPAVRKIIAQSNSRDRIAMAAALDKVLREAGADRERFPAEVVATAMAGMARVFATDRALGTAEGHPETLAFVERLLCELEPIERRRNGAVADQCRASPPAKRSATPGDHDAVDQRA